MPYSLDLFPDQFTHKQIQEFDPVRTSYLNKLKGAAEVLHRQVQRYLLPETYRLITGHLACVDYILVSKSTGPKPKIFGLSQPMLPGPTYLAIALMEHNDDEAEEEEIGDFELSSTKFHELGHLADPMEDRIPYLDFHAELQEIYADTSFSPDPEMEIALAEPIEAGVRSFECPLYGTPNTKTELWRQQHRPVVPLVDRYQLSLFQPPPEQRIRRKTAVKQPTTLTTTYPADTTPVEQDYKTPVKNPIKTREPRVIRCVWDRSGRGWIHSPLQRGITRWVKEQARQAVLNPDRAWYGALAEYLQLKNGTHPDPDPAKLIYPHNPDRYDPNNLEIEPVQLRMADDAAKDWVTNPIFNNGETKPPQPLARSNRML